MCVVLTAVYSNVFIMVTVVNSNGVVGTGEYTGAAATADYIIQPNSSSAFSKTASRKIINVFSWTVSPVAV